MRAQLPFTQLTNLARMALKLLSYYPGEIPKALNAERKHKQMKPARWQIVKGPLEKQKATENVRRTSGSSKKKKKEEKENKPLPQREKRIMSRLPILFTPFHSLSLSCGRFVISILFSNDFPPLIAHLFLVFTVQFSPLQRSDRVINMSKHFARYP